jgi:hypothetical protein
MAVPLCKESQPLYLPQGVNLKLQPLVNFEYVSGLGLLFIFSILFFGFFFPGMGDMIKIPWMDDTITFSRVSDRCTYIFFSVYRNCRNLLIINGWPRSF